MFLPILDILLFFVLIAIASHQVRGDIPASVCNQCGKVRHLQRNYSDLSLTYRIGINSMEIPTRRIPFVIEVCVGNKAFPCVGKVNVQADSETHSLGCGSPQSQSIFAVGFSAFGIGLLHHSLKYSVKVGVARHLYSVSNASCRWVIVATYQTFVASKTCVWRYHSHIKGNQCLSYLKNTSRRVFCHE